MGTTGRLLEEDVSVCEGIVRVLEEVGIDMVFGISGGNVYTISEMGMSIRTVIGHSLCSISSQAFTQDRKGVFSSGCSARA